MRKMPVPNLIGLDLLPLEKAVADYLKAVQGIPADSSRPSKKPRSKPSLQQKELFSENRSKEALRKLTRPTLLRSFTGGSMPRSYGSTTCRRLWNARCSTCSRAFADGACRSSKPSIFRRTSPTWNNYRSSSAITVDWDKTNLRRAKLLDLEEEEQITADQQKELDELQRLADASVSLIHPVQIEGGRRNHRELKRAGQWKG